MFGSGGFGGLGQTPTTTSSSSAGLCGSSTNTFGTATGSLFGQTVTPARQPNTMFGQQQPSTFGSGTNSGFSFGLASTAAPAFGSTATFSQNPVSQAPNTSFGITSNTGGLFGANAQTQPTAGGFGGPSPSASRGFGFGTSPAQTTQSSLSLGSASTSLPATGFKGFSSIATVQPSATGSFGSPSTTTGLSTTTFALSLWCLKYHSTFIPLFGTGTEGSALLIY